MLIPNNILLERNNSKKEVNLMGKFKNQHPSIGTNVNPQTKLFNFLTIIKNVLTKNLFTIK